MSGTGDQQDAILNLAHQAAFRAENAFSKKNFAEALKGHREAADFFGQALRMCTAEHFKSVLSDYRESHLAQIEVLDQRVQLMQDCPTSKSYSTNAGSAGEVPTTTRKAVSRTRQSPSDTQSTSSRSSSGAVESYMVIDRVDSTTPPISQQTASAQEGKCKQLQERVNQANVTISRLRQDKVQLKSRLENADKRAAYSEHQLRHLRRILAQLVPGTPWDGTPSSLELPPAKRNDLRAIVAALPDLWETQKFRMPATGEVASSSNASISRNPDTADVVHCTTAESSVPAAIMQPSSPHGLSPRKLSPEGFSGNADRPCTTAQPLTPNIRHHATASPGHAAGTASVRHGGGAEDCNEDPPSTGGGPREQHKEQASHPGRGSHHESPSPSASGGSMTHAGTKNRTPRGRGGSTGSSAGSSMSMEDLLRMQDKVIDALQSSQLS
eukprot:m.450245 g.450245  ORF g.450245 m.450245 type:complete len:440 (-) comp21512_c0_seq6:534-1853(-)